MRFTLQSIAAVMIFIFFLFSLLFYILLKSYFEHESFKRIEQATRFDKALQSYISDIQKPALYSLIKNGQLPKDFFDPKLFSSTFIANHVNDALISQKFGNKSMSVRLKFASDNPTNNRNMVTAYERKVLEKFRKNKLIDYKDRINIGKNEHLFYALAVERNTDQCLKCHGTPSNAPKSMRQIYGDVNGFGESKGHLRAIITVYTSVDAENNEMLLFFWSIEMAMFIIFAIIYGIIYHYSQTITQKDALIARQSRFAAMGEMVGMIAHQWRQPLTGISMTINNMKLDIELSMIDEKKWEQQLDVIEKQIEYLSHTIDDFRNFFKPNQSHSIVNIKELIEGSIGVIGSTLKSNNINIKIICDEQMNITTARNDLMQILLNIVKNSTDAYVETGISPSVLIIHVTQQDTWVIISIKDNAGGISPSIIDKIFNPYFSTKDDKNGTGLGLYMSKTIIQDHLGGKLEVSSSDGSTEFKIWLPKGDADGN